MHKLRPLILDLQEARYDKYRPMSSPFDPNGSYTGTAEFDDIPTQDADDL